VSLGGAGGDMVGHADHIAGGVQLAQRQSKSMFLRFFAYHKDQNILGIAMIDTPSLFPFLSPCLNTAFDA